MSYLSHKFLLAMPDMQDPQFQGALIYMVEHDQDGAFGFVVNKNIAMDLDDLLRNAKINNPNLINRELVYGGPVGQEQGFILYHNNDNWPGALTNQAISVSYDTELLEAIAQKQGPIDFTICLGYCGWGAGQLEQELKQNAWLICDFQSAILFATPCDDMRKAVLNHMGIDPLMLSNHGGEV